MCTEVGFVKRVKRSRHIVYSVRSAGLIPIDPARECSDATVEIISLQTGFKKKNVLIRHQWVLCDLVLSDVRILTCQ